MAIEPYFFPDGSALLSNGLGNPGSCPIVIPPDTFPHRYIVKIDPQGFWDSTFTPDANHHPRGFMPYDSKRIFVYGISKYFTHYDGVQVNGLCRIYLDGTLDTTFKTPLLSDTVEPKAFKIAKIENNGSFFITGDFILKEFPSQQHYLLKFHSDGMIDSSFRTNHNLKKNEIIIGINDIVSTPDNGYIITGFFDSIQGYPKHNIAKLDSMGKVEPQYFTTEGPDSSLHWGANYAGVRVLKSKFGGYYVYGDFAKWDGKPTQPIVRLKELTTSLEEKNQSTAEIEVFPNPSQAIFNVQSSLPIKQMMLFNLNGSQLNTINCNSNCSINLSNYSSGVYLLRLILNNGEIHHCKLIKH